MSMPTPFGRRETVSRADLDPGAAWRHVDWLLVAAVLATAGLGALMIFSSTRNRRGPGIVDSYFLERQALFIVIGVGLMAFTAAFDYRRLRDLAPLLYGGAIFLLFGILTPLGAKKKGAQAWFALPGGFQLQPSEIAKVCLIVMLAAVCGRAGSSGEIEEMGPRRLWRALLVAGGPLLLIMLQPDLGTALVLGAATFAILSVSGVKARYLLLLVAGVALVATLVLKGGFLADYQKARLTTFLNPSAKVRGDAYNLNQSKVAIGSGGLVGKGLYNGSQTRLRYVPEQHTDFIFSVVGEELGLIGGAALIGLFGVIMWRTWRAAVLANDAVGSMICIGVLAMLTFQVFENVGMTMGIMPITGIPLPFVSYGGSATLACFMAVGLVLNVRMRRYS